MTNGSLMKVKSIAECSHWSILQYFWPALSDGLENQFVVFLRVAVLDRFYCTTKLCYFLTPCKETRQYMNLLYNTNIVMFFLLFIKKV